MNYQAGDYYRKFVEHMNNDLNTPRAIAVLWEMVKSNIPTECKIEELKAMDKILGLGLVEKIGKTLDIPPEVQNLANARNQAKKQKDFKTADELREQIKELGYIVEDGIDDFQIKKIL